MRRAQNAAADVAELVARNSYGKLVAFLTARTGDIAEAEDALSEAFAAALLDWQRNGVPENPEAWLFAVARRRLIDTARRRKTRAAAAEHLQLIAQELEAVTASKTQIADERLGLMFACAHPAIDAAVRAPLILQVVLGFDAATIASAFLVSPATMSQRLVRAKSKIKEAGVPFRVPERAELPERLDAVLAAIYAVFTEGWSDPAGTDTRRGNLAAEGIWLGRVLASLLPQEPEALGLLALMLHAEARRGARRNSQGEYVPLDQQDVALWDAQMIAEAEQLLLEASRIGRVGRYQLEAAVQSAHAARRRTGRAEWAAIERLYAELFATTPSPVIAINRAIAFAELAGAEAGLRSLDALAEDARLSQYQPYWAARADLLARTGDIQAAEAAYDQAIGLERDPAVRSFLQQRRRALRAADN